MHLTHSLVLTFLWFTTLVRSEYNLLYPPSARVQEAYSHSFPQSYLFPKPSSEFESSTFQYSVDQIPSWLTFSRSDNTTSSSDPILTFNGTPGVGDAYSSWVRIIRTSPISTHSFNRGFRISVSPNAPPRLNIPLASQIVGLNKSTAAVISSATTFNDSGSVGLHIPSAWSFSLGFRASTFQSNSSDLYYTATVNDGQERPSWLGFDNRTLTFYGVAPKGSSSSGLSAILPQTWNVTVGCSDFPNTPSAVSDSFLLVVSPGVGPDNIFPPVNATVGNQVTYNVVQSLQSNLTSTSTLYHGEFTDLLSQLAFSVTLDQDLASWLSWDSSVLQLSGQIPPSYFSTLNSTTIDVPISLLNATTDPVSYLYNTSIPINVLPFGFSFADKYNVSLSSNTTFGDAFIVDLGDWLVGSGMVQIETGHCELLNEGIRYDDASKSLKGTIPLALASTSPQSCQVGFTLLDADTQVTSASALNIVLPPNLFLPSSSSSASSHGGLSKGGIIALSVVAGFIALLGLCGVLFFLWRRVSSMEEEKDGDAEFQRTFKAKSHDMDFVDVIRDSYSRQYEKYKSYRESRDTAATVVGSGGLGISSDGKKLGRSSSSSRGDGILGVDADGKLTPSRDGAETPGSRQEKVLPVSLGRNPSLPKAREPDFVMVNVSAGSRQARPANGKQATEMGTVQVQSAVIPLQVSTSHPSVTKALSPSPKRHQAERTNAPSPLRGPPTHSRNESQSTTSTGDKPRRMDLMRIIRGTKGSPKVNRSNISNPKPHSNPAYRPEASSVASHAIPSPEFFSSSENSHGFTEGDSFSSSQSKHLGKRRRGEAEGTSPEDEVGMTRTWSSSRFSADTFSSTGTQSWESEELWRQQRLDGVQGIDDAASRTRKRSRSDSKTHSRRREHQGKSSKSTMAHLGSPVRSSGITMAERLRLKMAQVGGRIESFTMGTPDSVVPRRRRDFEPPRKRPTGAVYSEGEEDGEFVVREEDVFGVVKPISAKSLKNGAARRSAKSTSSLLLPSFMPMQHPAANTSAAALTTPSTASDEVGRSFPNDHLDFEEYGHWLTAGILASPVLEDDISEEDEEEDDDLMPMDDERSSYHRATLVPAGSGGNVALRHKLVSPIVTTKATDDGRLSPGSQISQSASPIMVTTATAYSSVAEARRSYEPTRGLPMNASMTSIDTPSIVISSSTSVDKLHGLGLSDADLGGTEDNTTLWDDSIGAMMLYPPSPSKQTVRLVDGPVVQLSPDSISSTARKHQDLSQPVPPPPMPPRPFIIVHDTSAHEGDAIPMRIFPAGRALSFHPPILSSGRSTPSGSPRPTYSAMLESGAKLPGWLNFDPSAMEFWGLPEKGDVGHLVLIVVKYAPLPPAVVDSGRRTPSVILDEGEVVGRLILVIS